jgi:very-short-patch-repair endonuclease
MLKYDPKLKSPARLLRRNLTESERALWARLRNKQLFDVQFYRQKAIGKHIVDFYAPKVNLVVEIDGSQHLQDDHLEKDRRRDAYLASLGLKVLRFNSREVLEKNDSVAEVIYRVIGQSIAVQTSNTKSLLPSLYKREVSPSLKKSG